MPARTLPRAAFEHPGAEARGRIDLRHRVRQTDRDARQLAHLDRALRAREEMRLERAPLVLAEHAKRITAGELPQLVVRHAGHSPAIASLSFSSPDRIRVFTVPSGCCSRSAMSLCDRPS